MAIGRSNYRDMAMKTIHRVLVPILWLVSLTAGAVTVGDAHEIDRPSLVSPSRPSGNHQAAPGATPIDEDAEAIMQRVRAVIEELKRQGPPPVDCMEG